MYWKTVFFLETIRDYFTRELIGLLEKKPDLFTNTINPYLFREKKTNLLLMIRQPQIQVSIKETTVY